MSVKLLVSSSSTTPSRPDPHKPLFDKTSQTHHTLLVANPAKSDLTASGLESEVEESPPAEMNLTLEISQEDDR